MNQRKTVKKLIDELLDDGYTDKREIYIKVEQITKVPQASIRKMARELRLDMMKKVAILEGRALPIEPVKAEPV